MRRVWEAVVGMFICIYCGNYSGPYADVQAHQATCDARPR